MDKKHEKICFMRASDDTLAIQYYYTEGNTQNDIYAMKSKARHDFSYEHIGEGVYIVHEFGIMYYESLSEEALEEVRKSLLIAAE